MDKGHTTFVWLLQSFRCLSIPSWKASSQDLLAVLCCVRPKPGGEAPCPISDSLSSTPTISSSVLHSLVKDTFSYWRKTGHSIICYHGGGYVMQFRQGENTLFYEMKSGILFCQQWDQYYAERRNFSPRSIRKVFRRQN